MQKITIAGPSWSVIIHALIMFDDLERLCSISQKSLDIESKELEVAMDIDYEQLLDNNDEDAYFRHINDEYILVTEELPCLTWYSQFLVAYSFFERSLDAICLSIGLEKKLPLSLKDMGGNGISRARVYLSKLCNKGSAFSTLEWQTAMLFSEIRNSIAHRNGYIDISDDSKSLYMKLQRIELELKSEQMNQEDAQIILTKDFTFKAIKLFQIILKDIGGLERSYIPPQRGVPSTYNR